MTVFCFIILVMKARIATSLLIGPVTVRIEANPPTRANREYVEGVQTAIKTLQQHLDLLTGRAQLSSEDKLLCRLLSAATKRQRQTQKLRPA